MESLPELFSRWTATFGSLKERKRMSGALSRVASTIEKRSVLSSTEVSDGVVHGSTVPLQFVLDLAAVLHHDLGQFSAERVIATLRFYSKMLLVPELITNDPELPLEDTLKYALSGYVEHMTGESHDDSVAAVLAHGLPSGRDIRHQPTGCGAVATTQSSSGAT